MCRYEVNVSEAGGAVERAATGLLQLCLAGLMLHLVCSADTSEAAQPVLFLLTTLIARLIW